MNIDQLISNAVEDGTTHIYSVAAAISRFPELSKRLFNKFYGNNNFSDKEIKIIDCVNDKTEKELIKVLINGEKDKNNLYKIILDFINSDYLPITIKTNIMNGSSSEEYKLACALLDDYLTYLETGQWNGLTGIIK